MDPRAVRCNVNVPPPVFGNNSFNRPRVPSPGSSAMYSDPAQGTANPPVQWSTSTDSFFPSGSVPSQPVAATHAYYDPYHAYSNVLSPNDFIPPAAGFQSPSSGGYPVQFHPVSSSGMQVQHTVPAPGGRPILGSSATIKPNEAFTPSAMGNMSLINAVGSMNLSDGQESKPHTVFNPNATEFVPRMQQSANQYYTEPYLDSSAPTYGNEEGYYGTEPSLEAFQDDVLTASVCDGLSALVTQPGCFDPVSQHILTVMYEQVLYENALSFVIDLIFETAVTAPHCTYICAKLCNFLSKEYQSPHSSDSQKAWSSFRQLLFKRCHAEHEVMHQLLADKFVRMENFVLFLAELYLQMDMQGTRFSVLHKAIAECVQLLLNPDSYTDDGVKLAVRTLKCCGASFEEDEVRFTKATATLDGFVDALQKLVLGAPHLAAVVDSLVRLRADGWGKHELAPPQQQHKNGADSSQSSSLLQFGPDGMPLSHEEAEFLDSCMTPGGEDESNPEMSENDEYDDAYEQFLKIQEERKRQS